MERFTKRNVLKALSDLSINLASAWLGVLLISPGFFGVTGSEYLKTLLFNLIPALISLTVGVYLMQNEYR